MGLDEINRRSFQASSYYLKQFPQIIDILFQVWYNHLMNERILELLKKKSLLEKSLSELIYGAVEVREEGKAKYIYVHYRLSGKQITSFVGKYSEELLNLIANNNQKAKSLKKELKSAIHQLHKLGYVKNTLSTKVKRNLDFARRNLALTIHSQAILEGVATTFASTEDIIEGAKVTNMSPKDIAKIVNMPYSTCMTNIISIKKSFYETIHLKKTSHTSVKWVQ